VSDIVREGYRRTTFDEWRHRVVDPHRERWLQLLLSKLEPDARVLELGCGKATVVTIDEPEGPADFQWILARS
jgi:hypothetical protein